MSDREIQRRLRRAAAARQHGHPEPKNNRIPTAAARLMPDAVEQQTDSADYSHTGTSPQPFWSCAKFVFTYETM